MDIKRIRDAYAGEAKNKDGQFKTSGIVAEEEVWPMLKARGWARNNTEDKTDPDFITPSGKPADLKLCQAHKYGGNIFHEIIQNQSHGSLADNRPEVYIYFDVLAPGAPMYIFDKEENIERDYMFGYSTEETQQDWMADKPTINLRQGGHSDKQALGVLIHTAGAAISFMTTGSTC